MELVRVGSGEGAEGSGSECTAPEAGSGRGKERLGEGGAIGKTQNMEGYGGAGDNNMIH